MTKRRLDVSVTDKEPTLMVATRTFDFPRVQVFAALTKLLDRWHYAPGFEVSGGSLGLAKGGGGRGAYLEVVAPERLVYSVTFAARRGEPGSGAPYLIDSETGEKHPMPSRGLDKPRPPDRVVEVTDTLEERDGATTLTSKMVFASLPDRTHFMKTAVAGLAFSLDNLERFLRSSAKPVPSA